MIFLDFPAGKISPLAKKALSHKKKILITVENEVVSKNNWNINNHNFFDVILTWNDDYIDNAKYFKIMVPGLSQHYQEYDLLPFHKKENLSCMVSWNKKYNHRRSSDYIVIIHPRHGKLAKQLPKSQSQYELISNYSAMFDGSIQSFQVYYDSNPDKHILEATIR